MSVKYTSYSAEVLADLKQAKTRSLEIIGGTAEGYAKEICPVGETGNLRDGITHQRVSENTEAIGTNTKYAPYVEMGHHQEPGRYVPAIGKRLVASFVRGKPFLRPALDHGDEYVNIVKSEYGIK